MAESSDECRDEGHDFSLIGSGKRFGAIRRAIFVQYRARSSMRPRKPKTERMLATIAVMRVVSNPAIVFSSCCFVFGVYNNMLYVLYVVLWDDLWAAGREYERIMFTPSGPSETREEKKRKTRKEENCLVLSQLLELSQCRGQS